MQNRFLMFSFFQKLSFYSPFFALFLSTIHGIESKQILMILSIYSVSMFIFEIPTGLISDYIGEKKTIILGCIFLLISTTLFAFGSLYLFYIGEVLFAISQCFFSGSYESLMYHHYADKEEIYKSVLSKSTSLSWISISCASVISSLIARYNIYNIFYLTIIMNIITLVVSTTLPDSVVNREKSITKILRLSFKTIITTSNLKIWIIFSSIYMSIIICGYHLIQTYLNETGYASSKNGIIYFLITISAAISSYIYPKISSKIKIKENNILVILFLLLTIIFIALGLSKQFAISVVLFCLFRLVWGFSSPFIIKNLNESIQNNNLRSSIFSIGSLFMNGLIAISLAFIGKFSAVSGYAILALSIFLLAILYILLLKFNPEKK